MVECAHVQACLHACVCLCMCVYASDVIASRHVLIKFKFGKTESDYCV